MGVRVGWTDVCEGWWALGGMRVGSTGTQGVSDESDESDGRWWRGRDQNSEDIRMEARAYQTTTHRTAKRVAPISLARPASFPH